MIVISGTVTAGVRSSQQQQQQAETPENKRTTTDNAPTTHRQRMTALWQTGRLAGGHGRVATSQMK